MRDMADVHTASDDELEHRVTQQFARDRHRNGADAGDLAQLVPVDGSALERSEIYPKQCQEPWCPA